MSITRWFYPPYHLHRVIVNLRESSASGDVAVTGVVFTSRGRFIVLKDASLLMANREPQRLDGEIVIERDAVLFVQMLPPLSGPAISIGGSKQ